MHAGKMSVRISRVLKNQKDSLDSLIGQLWARLGFRFSALSNQKAAALQVLGSKNNSKTLCGFLDLV